MYPYDYWATPLSVEEGASFGTVLDPARFPNGFPDTTSHVWNVIGHFDGEAAAACRYLGKGDDQSVAAILLTCRTTFVVTDLVSTDSS